ncbi:MAG TPA: hypothetical protein VID27_08050 [Blastocatellia bacterium]|jgi:hypothetical protein
MMMRAKTKTEITIEKRERVTIRLRGQRIIWCDGCAAQANMILPEEAAHLAQTTARAIFRRVEAGEVHFLEAEGGVLFICIASLELTKQKREEENEYH